MPEVSTILHIEAANVPGCPIFATALSSLRWVKRHQL